MRATTATLSVLLAACTPDPMAPTEPTVSITPHDPDTTRDLQVFIVNASTDEDSETIEYLFEWEVDGVTRDGQISDVLPSAETAKGETWVVFVRGSDGENTSSAAMGLTIIVNSAPSAELSLGPESPSASDDLVAEISISDADEDEATSSISWTRNGEETDYTEATLPASATLQGEVWAVTVVPTDGEDEGESVSAEVSIGNNAPVIDTLSLSPSEVYEETEVQALASVSDEDGDDVSLSFYWMVDGKEVLSGESDTIGGEYFDKGQEIQVRAIPSDGNQDGETMSSDAVVVLNTIPVASEVQISPETASAGDSLSCSYSYDDADGDEDQSTQVWTLNGSEVETPEELVSGDEVVCTITPYDGEEEGEAVSDSIIIDNSLPEMVSVELSPSSVGTDDTLSATASATDADGDSVSYAYAWYVEGSLVSETSSTLDGSSDFDKDDEVYVVVTPADSSGDGDPMSSDSVVVVNTPPEAPVIAIDPSSPVEGADPLLCEIETESYDADGDAVGYVMSWTVDGAVFTGTETTKYDDDTVPADQTAEGEIWVCAAVPDDGDDLGEPGEDEVEILGPDVVTDFSLEDVNKTSMTFGAPVSPRDYLEQVSGWYFGHAT